MKHLYSWMDKIGGRIKHLNKYLQFPEKAEFYDKGELWKLLGKIYAKNLEIENVIYNTI